MLSRLPLVLLLGASLATGVGAAERSWSNLQAQAKGFYFGRLVPPTVETSEARRREGDDPRWAATDWDDTAWPVASFRSLPSHAGIFWIRFHLRDLSAPLPDALRIEGTFAHEIFWDGVLLGGNGHPGRNAQEERTGPITYVLDVPAERRGPGEHVVAVRASSYRDAFPAPTMPVRIMPVPAASYHEFERRSSILPEMALGAMLMVTLTSLVMWLLAARQRVLLWFAALCLCATFNQASGSAQYDFVYDYQWHYAVVLVRWYSADLLGLCLLALLIVLFDLPRRSGWVLLALPLVGFALGWLKGGGNRTLLTAALLLAVVAAGVTAWRGRRAAWLVLAGLLVTTAMWLIDPIHFFLASFLRDFSPTLLGLTAAIALQVRQARRRARDMELTAARMEIELLKKNLQPHFLVNTLAVVGEIIEADPARAVRLVDDLAHGVRTMARMTGEKLIPLEQELELCRAHLRVMSIRTGTTWDLEVTNADAALRVPPAVFLTLIENGFAHQQGAGGTGKFILQGESLASQRQVRFTFVSPGRAKEQPDRPAGGTGLRYVKARLEESFPRRWTFRDGPVAGGWQTVIELGAET